MTMRVQVNCGTVDFHTHPVDDVFRREAVLPLPCVDGAVKETAYVMDALGAAGVFLLLVLNLLAFLWFYPSVGRTPMR